ncbi:small VCP/p97-interacting protein [Columba livia]|uniref:Small VCP/p97-interacting protein n=1 Tax=Columba livia TaxID=8932 RepID=A0A2I0MI51_COLLI|nr:small VCP/p97-interacting protein [Columba livia]
MFLVLACQRWGDGFSHVEVLSLPVVSPYEYVVWSVNVCMYVCLCVTGLGTAQVPTWCFQCLFQALQFKFSLSPYVESCS